MYKTIIRRGESKQILSELAKPWDFTVQIKSCTLSKVTLLKKLSKLIKNKCDKRNNKPIKNIEI